MYRHTKKKCCRYVQIQTSDFSAFIAFYHEYKSSSSPASSLPTTLRTRHSITTHLLSMPNSVMSTSIASVTNNLESTNNLAHCEETQKLGSNYGSRHQLGTVDISERLKEALWVGCCRRGEQCARVSYALDQTLEVCLEG
jgi:hypothetical protein